MKTIYLIFCLFCGTNGFMSVDLSNQRWMLVNDSICVEALVPGSAHIALLHNKLIKDPFVGYRDVEYRWIADQQWEFKTKFTASMKIISICRSVVRNNRKLSQESEKESDYDYYQEI